MPPLFSALRPRLLRRFRRGLRGHWNLLFPLPMERSNWGSRVPGRRPTSLRSRAICSIGLRLAPMQEAASRSSRSPQRTRHKGSTGWFCLQQCPGTEPSGHSADAGLNAAPVGPRTEPTPTRPSDTFSGHSREGEGSRRGRWRASGVSWWRMAPNKNPACGSGVCPATQPDPESTNSNGGALGRTPRAWPRARKRRMLSRPRSP